MSCPRRVWCSAPLRFLYLLLAISALMISLGMWFWKPRVEAIQGLQSCQCKITNASLQLNIDCWSSGNCAVQFRIDVDFLTVEDPTRKCVGNRTATFVMDSGRYGGSRSDKTLLGLWPVGNFTECYQSRSPLLPACNWFCMNSNITNALSATITLMAIMVCLFVPVIVAVVMCFLVIPGKYRDLD